ncbi:MAG TPA: hypothetical protein VEP72_05980 [Microbacterium sp.]|nr:hypothetical protein [Microbacterium sp.]
MSTIAMTAMNWIRWIRLIVSGAPNSSIPGNVKIASGKNSSIDGPWNSPPSSAVLAIRLASWVNSAGSSFGAPVIRGDDGRCERHCARVAHLV